MSATIRATIAPPPPVTPPTAVHRGGWRKATVVVSPPCFPGLRFSVMAVVSHYVCVYMRAVNTNSFLYLATRFFGSKNINRRVTAPRLKFLVNMDWCSLWQRARLEAGFMTAWLSFFRRGG